MNLLTFAYDMSFEDEPDYEFIISELHKILNYCCGAITLQLDWTNSENCFVRQQAPPDSRITKNTMGSYKELSQQQRHYQCDLSLLINNININDKNKEKAE